jgi:hypothetical protein
MIRTAPAYLFLAVVLLMSGCPKPKTLELQNRSGRDAVVHAGDKIAEWKKDEILRLPVASDLVVWREDGAVRRPWLFVKVDDKMLEFVLNYMLPEGWSLGSTDRLELGADLLFYAVRAGGGIDQQPAGFPLHPKEANQPPLQTPASGTPAANAPVAPPSGAAGL